MSLVKVCLLLVLCGVLYACWLLTEYMTMSDGLNDKVILGDGWLSVPLVDSSETAPMISASFGSSNRSAVVLLDTGSDQFWVRRNVMYDSQSLVMTQEVFTTVYAGGSVRGLHASDNISLGNMSWRQPIGLVHESTTELKDIQSILGLSRKCRRECSISNFRLKKPQLGFVFDLVTRKGSFLAGVTNASLCKTGEVIHWVPLLPNHLFWRSSVSLRLGDTAIGDRLVAIWDTGTTYTFLRSGMYDGLVSKLPGIDEICIFRDLPDFSLVLNGVTFTFPPDVYAQRRSDNTCAWNFAKLEDTWGSRIEGDVIIGWTLIRSHYVVFDMSEDAIGICRSQSLDFVRKKALF